MIEGSEFALPDGEGEPTPGSPTNPPPVIVIEYRNRGVATRLVPPALIVLAALAISSYQRTTPVSPLAPRTRSAASAPVLAPPGPPPVSQTVSAEPPAGERTGHEAVPTPAAPSGSVRVETQAEAPKTVAPLPASSAEHNTTVGTSPFDLDPGDGLRPVETPAPSPTAELSATPVPAGLALIGQNFEPSPDVPPTGMTPDRPPMGDEPRLDARAEPEPSRDDILRDIEREAEQKDARRQDLEGLKNNSRTLLLREAIAEVQASRAPFRDELRRALAGRGDDVGDEIVRLCERYGKEPLPEVKAAYVRLLRTAPNRLSRQASVELMRAVGVPEPLILDQLCHDFDKLMNTRNGPRSQSEVRVRAARALLAIPLSPRKPANGSGA